MVENTINYCNLRKYTKMKKKKRVLELRNPKKLCAHHAQPDPKLPKQEIGYHRLVACPCEVITVGRSVGWQDDASVASDSIQVE